MTELSPTSRHRLTEQKVDDFVSPGRLRFTTWKVPEIDLTDYSLYTVTGADVQRIDLISYETYGDVQFWWAIALVNNIANPLCDLVPGTTLVIPKLEAISAALAQVTVDE